MEQAWLGSQRRISHVRRNVSGPAAGLRRKDKVLPDTA